METGSWRMEVEGRRTGGAPSRPRGCRGLQSAVLRTDLVRSFQDGADAEEVVLALGGVGQHILLVEGGPGLIVSHHVVHRQRLGRGRELLRVHLAQALEVVQDLRKLYLENGDVVVAEADAGKPCDAFDFVWGQGQGAGSWVRYRAGWKPL